MQLPLPDHLNPHAIIGIVGSQKDVDGFHPLNVKRVFDRKCDILPVFPQALLCMARKVCDDLAEKNVAIVAKEGLFSSTMERICLLQWAHPTPIHDLSKSTERKRLGIADVIFSAHGTVNLITPDIVRDGVVIIDGGINQHEGKIVGDVDHDAFVAAGKNLSLSPVPGGVGPVTIACILANLVAKTQKQISQSSMEMTYEK